MSPKRTQYQPYVEVRALSPQQAGQQADGTIARVVAGQYQSVASPVFVPAAVAEDVTLDKWFQPAGEPVRVRLRANVGPSDFHRIAIEQFAPPELSWKSVTPDFARGPRQSVRFLADWFFWHTETPTEPAPELSWKPTFPDAARSKNQSARFLAEWLSWHTETPAAPSEPDRKAGMGGAIVIGIKRRRQYQATAAPSFVPFVEVFQPQFLTWLPKAPDKVYGRAPLRHQGRHQFFTPRLPELPGWWQPASTPVFKRYRKAQPLDWSVWAPFEIPVITPIQLDQWWQPAAEPVRVKPQRNFALLYSTDLDVTRPEARLDSWEVYRPEPVRRTPNIRHQWLYDPLPAIFPILPPPPPAPPLDSWNFSQPVAVRGLPATYQMGEYTFWYTQTGPDVIRSKRHFSLVISRKRGRRR